MWYEIILSRGIFPEFLIRIFLRIFYEIRFSKLPKNIEEIQSHLNQFIKKMELSPMVITPTVANEQHYELPSRFFKNILGKYMKYSCGYWKKLQKKSDKITSLSDSEKGMLKLTCQRAEIKDGERILDLGCGWGSLSRYIKENYKNTTIMAVSNSRSQKEFIEKIIKENKFENFDIITQNIANLELKEKYDIIVTIEMMEHVRNYTELFEKLTRFLKPGGRLFIHIFTDKNYPYFFEMNNSRNFMTKYFFRGGMMPSTNLPLYFTEKFILKKKWILNGKHYQKTLDTWLERMKSNKSTLMPILKNIYEESQARKWWNYWKLFFISLSEVFGFKNGNRRFVSHYLLEKRC